MKKRIDNLITITTLTLILILSFMFIVIKKEDFSENENRYLQTIPLFSISNIVSGKYTSNFEKFLNDHFPFRNNLVGLKVFSEKLIGKTKINNIYIARDGYLISDYTYSSKKTDMLSKTINDFILKNANVNIETMIVPNAISVYKEKMPINNVKSNQIDDTKKTSNSLYNYSYLQKKDKYSTFLDNNHSLIIIDNLNLKNGNDILIIKNSYGNSFVPFL